MVSSVDALGEGIEDFFENKKEFLDQLEKMNNTSCRVQQLVC